jgi:hypothetical protein
VTGAPARAFVITAIAQSYGMVGYRTIFVRGMSEHEAIGYGLDVLQRKEPAKSFSEASALEISPDKMADLGVVMQPLTLAETP